MYELIDGYSVGGDNAMDLEKMRIISAVIMFFTALIGLLKCILWD